MVVMATKQAARRRPHCIGSQETKKRGTKINQSGAQAMCPNWTQTKCSSSCLRASPAITYKSDPLNAKWGLPFSFRRFQICFNFSDPSILIYNGGLLEIPRNEGGVGDLKASQGQVETAGVHLF